MALSAEHKLLLEKLIAVSAEIETIKKYYAEYDAIVEALRGTGFTSAIIGEQTFTLTDNFAHANTAYRVSFIKRFEIKVKTAKEKA